MSLNVQLLYFDAKAPSDLLDYMWDFSEWLAPQDTIESASIVTPTGLTLASHSNTNTTVTAWLSGGTAGVEYTVGASVVTTQGRQATRSAVLFVQQH